MLCVGSAVGESAFLLTAHDNQLRQVHAFLPGLPWWGNIHYHTCIVYKTKLLSTSFCPVIRWNVHQKIIYRLSQTPVNYWCGMLLRLNYTIGYAFQVHVNLLNNVIQHAQWYESMINTDCELLACEWSNTKQSLIVLSATGHLCLFTDHTHVNMPWQIKPSHNFLCVKQSSAYTCRY